MGKSPQERKGTFYPDTRDSSMGALYSCSLDYHYGVVFGARWSVRSIDCSARRISSLRVLLGCDRMESVGKKISKTP